MLHFICVFLIIFNVFNCTVQSKKTDSLVNSRSCPAKSAVRFPDGKLTVEDAISFEELTRDDIIIALPKGVRGDASDFTIDGLAYHPVRIDTAEEILAKSKLDPFTKIPLDIEQIKVIAPDNQAKEGIDRLEKAFKSDYKFTYNPKLARYLAAGSVVTIVGTPIVLITFLRSRKK